VLDYADLGMTIALVDMALSYNYEIPRPRFGYNDPRPDPRALARSDILATSGGRAVFPMLPPRVRPLKVEGCIARFEGVRGTKLLAQIEAPGTPVDSVWAQCVVTDSTEHEVARAGRALSPSGCEPAELRTGDFTFDVPPGVYRVAFSVRDATGARGVTRATQVVEALPAGLAMSDVVVTCGPIDIGSAGAPEIRLGPNLKARVAGEGPLVAYFEIYRMTAGGDGLAHFAYEYAVESEEKDPRPWYQRLLPFGGEPHYVVKSEETNVGPLRRQFLSVPVAGLKPGHYRLDLTVRDLTTGTRATGSARFQRLGGA
jgi:hypothetical protein